LDQEISNFDQRMLEMRQKRTEVEGDLSQIKRSSVAEQEKLGTQDRKHCLAKQRHQSELACRAQLLKRVKEFCRELHIPIDCDLVVMGNKTFWATRMGFSLYTLAYISGFGMRPLTKIFSTSAGP